jgi:hypothetical protein
MSRKVTDEPYNPDTAAFFARCRLERLEAERTQLAEIKEALARYYLSSVRGPASERFIAAVNKALQP